MSYKRPTGRNRRTNGPKGITSCDLRVQAFTLQSVIPRGGGGDAGGLGEFNWLAWFAIGGFWGGVGGWVVHRPSHAPFQIRSFSAMASFIACMIWSRVVDGHNLATVGSPHWHFGAQFWQLLITPRLGALPPICAQVPFSQLGFWDAFGFWHWWSSTGKRVWLFLRYRWPIPPWNWCGFPPSAGTIRLCPPSFETPQWLGCPIFDADLGRPPPPPKGCGVGAGHGFPRFKGCNSLLKAHYWVFGLLLPLRLRVLLHWHPFNFPQFSIQFHRVLVRSSKPAFMESTRSWRVSSFLFGALRFSWGSPRKASSSAMALRIPTLFSFFFLLHHWTEMACENYGSPKVIPKHFAWCNIYVTAEKMFCPKHELLYCLSFGTAGILPALAN